MEDNKLVRKPDLLSQLQGAPFETFFKKAFEVDRPVSFSDKVLFLDKLLRGFQQAESLILQEREQNTFVLMFGGFGTMFSFFAGAASGPIGWTAIALSACGSLYSFGKSAERSLVTGPIMDELRRYRQSLKTKENSVWVSIWIWCESYASIHRKDSLSMFFAVLESASRGDYDGAPQDFFSSSNPPIAEALLKLNSMTAVSIATIKEQVGAIKSAQIDRITSFSSQMVASSNETTEQIIDRNLLVGPIGSNTRMNAIDVAASNNPMPYPAKNFEGPTIGEYINNTAPSRDVESAIEQVQLTKEQVIALPLPQRAAHLMDLLAMSGCDLRRLAGRSTLAAGGLQRSGKTTLIVLLAILEKAMGQKIFYITRDTDLYPVAFDGYASDSTSNAVAALMNLSDRINNGQIGALRGETWILDEFSSTAKEMPDDVKNKFWGMALTGFAKQGGRVRFIVHHRTATANGIPSGESDTFKSEVKMFWTDRNELPTGEYQPSGQYELLGNVSGYYKETGEKFQIPEWLMTDTNPGWHNSPCPVRSLLQFFPEFDTRKGATTKRLGEERKQSPFAASATTPVTRSNYENPVFEGEEMLGRELVLREMPSLSNAKKPEQKALETQQLIFNFIAEKLTASNEVKPRDLVRKFKIETIVAEQYLQGYCFKNRSHCQFTPASKEDARIGAKLARI